MIRTQNQRGTIPPEPLAVTPEAESALWDTPAPVPDVDEAYRLVSLFTPAGELAADAFLNEANGRERFYWSEPHGGLTLAGSGVAAELRVAPVLDAEAQGQQLPGYRFEEIGYQAARLFQGALVYSAGAGGDPVEISAWREHPARPRLVGGFAFQDDFVPDNTWSAYNPAHFILPHYQLFRLEDEAFLTINALVNRADDLETTVAGLHEALAIRLAADYDGQPRPIALADVAYPMPPATWREMIEQATTEIAAGGLEKVVLSRVCEIRTEEPIDAAATLGYLERHYADCYRFIFEPIPGHAFFGATPELLISKSGDRIRTMALAGSIGRGRAPEQDEALAQQLLSSAKDRHEHQLVVDAIRGKLADATAELIIPERPTILQLSNIQHLFTPISGRLYGTRVSILSLVRRLHPTPAMGGTPPIAALGFLRRVEPVPRGWYAAPIGWMSGDDDGVFAVAIRSAVTQHARAWLYAGAGILATSDPEKEWAETGLKFRPMLGALGVAEGM